MGSPAVERIQLALQAKGFDPGSADGVWGRLTVAAVTAFQKANGLEADGIAGPQTTAALFAGAPPPPPAQAANTGSVLVWFEEAKTLLGTKEAKGNPNNPQILDWAKDLDIAYSSDDIPWCGLFVAHCVGSTLPTETLPGNPLGARQWATFGDKTTPRLGAVMVFWRESKQSGKGHVGLYNGEDSGAYQILGGNQSDSVSLAWVAKDRLLGARWPRSAQSLTSKPVMKTRSDGSLSTNEA